MYLLRPWPVFQCWLDKKVSLIKKKSSFVTCRRAEIKLYRSWIVHCEHVGLILCVIQDTENWSHRNLITKDNKENDFLKEKWINCVVVKDSKVSCDPFCTWEVFLCIYIPVENFHLTILHLEQEQKLGGYFLYSSGNRKSKLVRTFLTSWKLGSE